MRGTSGTDGKMETEGDREGWLEMNGTDDTNGSFETVGNADRLCRKRRLSRWGIVIRNGKTVGVAVGTNDWVGTQGPLWGRVMGPSVGASQRFCAQSKLPPQAERTEQSCWDVDGET